MSEERQILAVDGQKATFDFMRSVLSLAEDVAYEISWAPSAEEGLLELRSRPFDLLVAGIRLPGMDGLELTRRAHQLRPAMPVILSSIKPLAEWQAEASSLGVRHCLSKPLDAEEFLSAVQGLIRDAPLASQTLQRDARVEAQMAIPGAAAERLETLRAEIGAGQVLLVTVGGELLHATGSQLHPDLPRLVEAISANVSCSLYLSDQLAEEEPRAIQFLQGETCDLYWANVDRRHFIVILFDAHVRRGRIGTVWVFAQRAAATLRSLLEPTPGNVSQAEPSAQTAELVPRQGDRPNADVQQAPAEVEPEPPDESPQAPGVRANAELDAFWDQAVADDSRDDVFTTGISLEEARARGLIGDDFDPEDE